MKKLANYKAVAEGIAMLYFPHAEVIIHDIKTQTVVHIANNLSKRQLGDDSALHELRGNVEAVDNLGPYEKLSWNGQRIRSVTSVMRDDSGKPEALLCINMNSACWRWHEMP
ncbi:putative transcriptional regulator YheO [Pseudomonas sp. S3E17]|nr:putative transcriptional regulator YheO [Pseudomonas sp. S3E17]